MDYAGAVKRQKRSSNGTEIGRKKEESVNYVQELMKEKEAREIRKQFKKRKLGEKVMQYGKYKSICL